MIQLNILAQPDDITCGPTSLHAVYQYYQFPISLKQVIREVTVLEDGGTLGVLLGSHALKKGFKVKVITYNLKIFDPSWFGTSGPFLRKKLRAQLRYKKGKKFEEASKAYMDFLALGGEILFEDLTADLLQSYFQKDIPLLVGLSATYLYNCQREYTNYKNKSIFDDLRGFPMGHFVVLCGLDEDGFVSVADPYKDNPISEDHYYHVDIHRLINSILLGIVTYDANLLIIEKKHA